MEDRLDVMPVPQYSSIKKIVVTLAGGYTMASLVAAHGKRFLLHTSLSLSATDSNFGLVKTAVDEKKIETALAAFSSESSRKLFLTGLTGQMPGCAGSRKLFSSEHHVIVKTGPAGTGAWHTAGLGRRGMAGDAKGKHLSSQVELLRSQLRLVAACFWVFSNRH